MYLSTVFTQPYSSIMHVYSVQESKTDSKATEMYYYWKDFKHTLIYHDIVDWIITILYISLNE